MSGQTVAALMPHPTEIRARIGELERELKVARKLLKVANFAEDASRPTPSRRQPADAK